MNYEELTVGTRVRQTLGKKLTGVVAGFRDAVDLDAVDEGCTEEEATVADGVALIELDPESWYRVLGGDGQVTVVKTASCYYDQWNDFWEPAENPDCDLSPVREVKR